MKRRTWILGSLGLVSTAFDKADQSLLEDMGEEFKWGVANAAFQVEGATREGGRSISIWDDFTKKRILKDSALWWKSVLTKS